jgi:hypothetical protein
LNVQHTGSTFEEARDAFVVIVEAEFMPVPLKLNLRKNNATATTHIIPIRQSTRLCKDANVTCREDNGLE